MEFPHIQSRFYRDLLYIISDSYLSPLSMCKSPKIAVAVRIKPKELEIPKANPFQHDLLNRKESIEVLTHIVKTIEGPCVISLDAPWGAGKTTYLNLWTQYLRNEGFNVINFNAWQTDFIEDPFLAISGEITKGLKAMSDNVKLDITGLERDMAKVVATQLLRLAVSSIPNVGKHLLSAFDNIKMELASLSKEQISNYDDAIQSFDSLNLSLSSVAKDLYGKSRKRPLIVIIDELDRCRPSYAVKFLEIAKHLFLVEHVVYVVSINRRELSHSVKVVYGDEFDAVGYLGRFFDLDFLLPKSDKEGYVRERLSLLKSSSQESKISWMIGQSGMMNTESSLSKFFGASDLSIRTIEQTIHLLGLVYAHFPPTVQDVPEIPVFVTNMLVLRTLRPDLYHKIFRNEATDEEVVDEFFTNVRFQNLRMSNVGYLFETIIILIWWSLNCPEDKTIRPLPKTSLMKKYYDYRDKEGNYNQMGDPQYTQAEKICGLINIYHQDSSLKYINKAFDSIELISRDFIPRTGRLNYSHHDLNINLDWCHSRNVLTQFRYSVRLIDEALKTVRAHLVSELSLMHALMDGYPSSCMPLYL